MASKDHPSKQAYKKSDTNENRLANDNAGDLRDSPRDRDELSSDQSTMNLPDADDIAGQEHVRAPFLGELADTTASSADEEGEGIFPNEEYDARDADPRGNVSREERELLEKAGSMMPNEEEYRLRAASLDNRDNEGEPLNEASFGNDMSGKDLDVPGADEDDRDEELGEEDEENNEYSISANDDNNETSGEE